MGLLLPAAVVMEGAVQGGGVQVICTEAVRVQPPVASSTAKYTVVGMPLVRPVAVKVLVA